MPQVPVNRVTWPSAQAFAADVTAAFERCGLSHASALIVTAHAALSSGWGGKNKNPPGLPGYNLTGMKVTPRQEATLDYHVLPGWEVINGKKVRGLMKWRAFGSLDAACTAMLGILRGAKRADGSLRYARSLALLMDGNPEYYRQLGADGWYTANPDEVFAGCMSRYRLICKWDGHPLPAPTDLGPIFGALAVAALLLL